MQIYYFVFSMRLLRMCGWAANVLQIITDNASNYVLVGKMFEEKHKAIFWIACVAYCIDLMLEDICKQDWIKDNIEHAKSITKYIYNHGWVLSLMRRHTQGRELVSACSY